MREFSEYERGIISGKLIQGAGLSHCFPDDFRAHVKIILKSNPNGSHKFEYFSDKYSSQQIQDALVDLVYLLEFLEHNGLLRIYYPAATSLKNYQFQEEVKLGDYQYGPSAELLLAHDAKHIAEFINRNEYNIFRATEPLRSLVNHGFRSLEERMHGQMISQQRIANIITLCIGIGSIFFIYYQNKNSNDELNFKIGTLNGELKNLREQQDNDSMFRRSLQHDNDSLKLELKTLKNRTAKFRGKD